MIKKNKKVKKPQPTVQVQSHHLEDVEINDFNDIIDDKLVEGLQKISVKKVTTTKEKERKVNEFKFRILDLVNIFVETSKNPEHLHSNLPKLVSVIQKYHKDRSQILYVQRIVKLVVRNLQRSDSCVTGSIEELANLSNNVIQVIHKCNNKALLKSLHLIYELSLKTIFKANSKMAKKLILDSVRKAVSYTATKRSTQVNSNLIKRVLKQFSFLAPYIYKQLKSFGEDLKQRRVSEIQAIEKYILKNPNLAQLIKKDAEPVQQETEQ